MRFCITILALLAAVTLGAAEGGDHGHKHGDGGKPAQDKPMDGDKPMAKDGEAKPYPLATCVVSGEKLGSMGKPVTKVHEGREVKFCCKSCIKDFKADPDKYIAKLDQAAKGDQGHKGHEHGDKPHKHHDHGEHKGHDHGKGHEGDHGEHKGHDH